MKLLIAATSLEDIAPFTSHFKAELQPDAVLKFLYSSKILHHEVDIVVTGVGVYQTTYKVTKVLSKQKYHLALKLGLGNAYKPETAIGTILNIVNEKPGDFGMMINGEWKDYYDFDLVKTTDEPHVKGGLINWTNAYLNVFLPFKKVVGVTVSHYADNQTYLLRKEKYKADCETCDGLGFVYPCLFEKQQFYQLCVIERNLATGEENPHLALEKMNHTLIDVVTKL
jgi:futalosine hydrolase